ncbi:MAG: hypothetical protein IPH48_10915 [bacterium]|nr:hypothetical protein [bacterium]
MMRAPTLLLVAAVTFSPIALPRIALGASDDHFDLALRWAPKFYCDIHADNLRADVPTDIHFDRDVDPDGQITNNWENLERVAPSARVYYAVVETETHFYISYFLYHPRDWESLNKKREREQKDSLEHEHDLEGVTLVVANPGGGLVVAYTQAHGDTYYFSDVSPEIPNCDEPIEGFPYSSWDHRDSGFGNGQAMPEDATMHFEGFRPLMFVEREGHGIGQIRRALEPNDSGPYTVSGATYRFYDNDGIVLVPATDGVSAAVPTTANEEYAYGLMSFADEFWAERTDGTWFSESYPTLNTMRGVVLAGLGGVFAVGVGHSEGASPRGHGKS